MTRRGPRGHQRCNIKLKRHPTHRLCPLRIVFRGNACKTNICGHLTGVKTKDRGRTASEAQSHSVSLVVGSRGYMEGRSRGLLSP